MNILSKRGRTVQILYVYQEPILAWNFVQRREAVEGRGILPEHFIKQYFAARDVVNTLKKVWFCFESGFIVEKHR